jgi:hypothetical protein
MQGPDGTTKALERRYRKIRKGVKRGRIEDSEPELREIFKCKESFSLTYPRWIGCTPRARPPAGGVQRKFAREGALWNTIGAQAPGGVLRFGEKIGSSIFETEH